MKDNMAEAHSDFKRLMKDKSIFRIAIIGKSVYDNIEVCQIVIIDRPTSSNGIWQVQTGVFGSMFNLMYLHKIKMMKNGIISGFRTVSGKRVHVTDIVLNKFVSIEGFSSDGRMFRRRYWDE